MRHTTKRGRGALAAGALIIASTAGCVQSSQPVNPGGPVSPNVSGSSSTGTSTTGAFTQPGCSDAMDALQNEGLQIAGMLNQPQSVATVAQDLSTKLDAAAKKATDPMIRSAVQAVADDFAALATAAGKGDTNGIQDAATKDAHDASTLVAVCT